MGHMKELFHQHLLLKVYINNPPIDPEVMNRWMLELVEDLGMVVACEPKSTYVDVVGNAGLTGSINIQTSHLAYHIWSEESPARVEMDVYSCACFEPETVLKKWNEFSIDRFHMMMIDRNSDKFQVTYQSDGYEKITHV
jgi:S-adenosylmethionine/arginine decarboxylase-like enzyme